MFNYKELLENNRKLELLHLEVAREVENQIIEQNRDEVFPDQFNKACYCVEEAYLEHDDVIGIRFLVDALLYTSNYKLGSYDLDKVMDEEKEDYDKFIKEAVQRRI